MPFEMLFPCLDHWYYDERAEVADAAFGDDEEGPAPGNAPSSANSAGGAQRQQSKAPTPKVRSEFPETWLWADVETK